MPTDKPQYEDGFDRMLRNALSGHKELVRSDFADDVLRQIQVRAQRKILAKVILQERLALAGCILLPITAVVVMLVFGEAVGGISVWAKDIYGGLLQAILTQQIEWRNLGVFVVAAGFAVYSVFDLFFADS